jgi:hypothetical protein
MRFETAPRQPNPQLPVATVDSPAVSPGKEQNRFDSVASRGCLNGFATFASENFGAAGSAIAQAGSQFTNQSEFSDESFEVFGGNRVLDQARLRGAGTGYKIGHGCQILRRV